ncbi:hypothetical protein N9L94_04190 [Robiginitalea sp.]|jgi:hypothetical protein|nr:hypothetical protein [Robiginitalea sp.]
MEQHAAARTVSVMAYFTLVGALIAIMMNAEPKHPLGRFHCRQAFGLHISFLGFALFLSTSFSIYAWFGLYALYLLMWIYGFLGALQSKERLVPLVGEYFQKWFTFIR